MPKKQSRSSSQASQRRYKTEMSNLVMPVPRLKSMLKVGKYANRVSDKSAVFMAAVLEYIVTEVLEMSLVAARREGAARIRPQHINMALKTDLDLGPYFRNAAIPASSFLPCEELDDFKEIRPKTAKTANETQTASRQKQKSKGQSFKSGIKSKSKSKSMKRR